MTLLTVYGLSPVNSAPCSSVHSNNTVYGQAYIHVTFENKYISCSLYECMRMEAMLM